MSHSPARSIGVSYWLAITWIGSVIAIGLLAPWLPLSFAPATPDLLHMATPPEWAGVGAQHWLGTDPQGRDVLAGLVYGARQVVLLSLPATMLATALGALTGGAAGFWGNRDLHLPLSGWLLGLAGAWWGLDLPGQIVVVTGLLLLAIATRVLVLRSYPHWLGHATWPVPLDTLLRGLLTLLGAVPRLILVIGLAAGPPLTTTKLLVLLIAVAWTDPARLVRTQMLRVRELPFVEAARAAGLPAWRIWLRHALPHACLPIWTTAPLSLAGLIGLETTLGFLGVGLPPDVPSWGRLLGTLRYAPSAWWLAAGPGLALLLTLLALRRLANATSHRLMGV
jgi:peptide/nickel transport system permease protein